MRNNWRSGALFAAAIIALTGLLSCETPPGSTEDGAEVLAITNVTVIPMDRERVLADHTVLIRDGRIDTVNASDGVSIPGGATVIDGRGKFLLPSLVDTHVHVDDPGDLAVFLAHGIGAVRNLEGLPYHVFLRDEVHAGRQRGPWFFTCGPYSNAPRIADPASAAQEIAAQAQAGYDCVKIHGDLTVETLVAMGQAAQSAGLPLIGHVPRNLELLEALDTGAMQEISHAEEYLYTHFAHRPREAWPEAINEAVRATKASGVDVTPTLVTYRSIAAQVSDLDSELARLPLQWVGPFSRRKFRPGNNRYQRKFETADAVWLEENLVLQKQLVLALHAAGVPLLTGTDANSPTNVPGFSLHEELALLVEIGLGPWDALQAATTHGWRRVSRRDDVGQVVVGMQAELLLLSADPLADIRNSTKIAGVVSRGEWLPAPMLWEIVDEQSLRYEREQPFIDLLWDNTIEDGVAFYRKRKEEDPAAFVFRADAMACQAVRSIRDGAPEVAVQAVELALEEYPGDAFLERLLRELRAGSTSARGATRRMVPEPGVEPG
jgi:hypothetical protein